MLRRIAFVLLAGGFFLFSTAAAQTAEVASLKNAKPAQASPGLKTPLRLPYVFTPVVITTPTLAATGFVFTPVIKTTPTLAATGFVFTPVVKTTPTLAATGFVFTPVVKTMPNLTATDKQQAKARNPR